MNNVLMAKAIVYAARQATLTNDWDAIETHTANILAGCSVAADGLKLVEPETANSIVMRVALDVVDNYHATKNELARTKEALRIESTAALQARRQAANEHDHMLTRLAERDAARSERDSLRRELEARIAQVDRLMAERDAQNDRANTAEKHRDEAFRQLAALMYSEQSAGVKLVKRNDSREVYRHDGGYHLHPVHHV